MESAEAKAFYQSCPECGGAVHRVARKCKHCGVELVPKPVQEAVPEPKPAIEHEHEHEHEHVAEQPRESWPPPPVAAPTPTSRRWMLAGVAVLVLAVGMALGIMIERGSHPNRSTATPPRLEVSTPQTHGFQHRPDDPDPDLDPDPGITSNWSFRSGPPPQRNAPSASDPSVEEFVSRLGNELCDKITNCGGADPAVGLLCRTIASNLPTDDVAEQVKSGECEYNAAAAAACIKGLEDLDCDTSGSATDPMADPFAMMMTVDSIMSCLQALSC